MLSKVDFCVDDCLVCVATEKEEIKTLTDMRAILSQGGFNLTKWFSNNDNVMSTVLEQHRSKSAKTLQLENSTAEKVLGVYWEIGSDTFRMKVNIPDKPYTRRGILSMVHSLFDPLGFVAPVLLEPNLLLRKLNDSEWDEAITDEEKRMACFLGAARRNCDPSLLIIPIFGRKNRIRVASLR